MRSIFILSAIVVCFMAFQSFQKNADKEPWTKEQLMPPAELAAKIKSGNLQNTTIFNIGPSGAIKNSVEIGPAQEAENLALLEKKLAKLSKDREVVIYCGCCPFQHCPNIRPAFKLLTDMHFKNAQLLNLPKNLKVDWIEKGYPLSKK